MNRVVKAVSEKLGSPISYIEDEYRFYCPFCIKRLGKRDTKGHLYINFYVESYFCHRCNSTNSLSRLLKFLKIQSDDLIDYDVDISELQNRIMFLKEERETDKYTEPGEVSFPEETYSAWEWHPTRSYAQKRGLTEEQCLRYDLRGYIDEKNVPRLLFPNYYKGKLTYWTARSCDNSEPKYRSDMGGKRSKSIWNLDNIMPSAPICVAEGVLSAMACGINGVALYGKFLSSFQLEAIKSKAKNGVRIILDSDAKKESIKAAKKFLSYGVPTGIVTLPEGKDPDETDRVELQNLIINSKEMNEIDLLRLML